MAWRDAVWWDLGSARAHLLPRGSGSETGVSAWVRTLLGSSGSGDAESQGRECVWWGVRAAKRMELPASAAVLSIGLARERAA